MITYRLNLASALVYFDSADETISRVQQIVAAADRVLGPTDRHTLIANRTFANVCTLLGREDEATSLLQTTLADCERTLGADPGTLAARRDLASVYVAAGRLDEGIPLLVQNVAEAELLFGPQHSLTFPYKAHLARACESAKRHAHAVPMLERALADAERFLGQEHPQTIATKTLLARSRESNGPSECHPAGSA